MSIVSVLLAVFSLLLPASDVPEVVPVDGDAVQQLIAEAEESVIVVNLWATWCAPCVEEFPELIEFAHQYQDKDVKLILVSADFDDQMEKLYTFLNKHNVDFTTYIKASQNDMEFIESFEPVQWQGALPLTIVYNQDRQPVASFNRKVTGEELRTAVDSLLK